MQATKWLGIELVEVSFKEKLISAVGSALAIYCVFWCTLSFLPSGAAIGVVASMGATAVLLFAVPHGQLSQPWPLIGGHLVSALIGVSCARLIANPVFATALAVGASIGARTRCFALWQQQWVDSVEFHISSLHHRQLAVQCAG